MKDKNYELLKNIAETLHKYASGDYFTFDGELYALDPDDPSWTGDDHYDPETESYYIGGEVILADEVEIVTLWDYFSDYYNIDYICDSNKDLKAVRVMIACGGPNIYINTWERQVELYWWSSSETYYLDCDICDQINDLFNEMWLM